MPDARDSRDADDAMRMITCWQPYASLIGIGAKRIETRGYATTYRGPLVIHAAKTSKPWRDLDAPSLVGERGTIDAILAALDAVIERDATGAAQAWVSPHIDWDGMFIDLSWHDPDDPVPGRMGRGTYMPLGAVVAVADLVDVFPILTDGGIWAPGKPHDVDTVIRREGDGLQLWCHEPDGLARVWRPRVNLVDELPFGDYTSGRYGWMLDNVRPLPEPIPWRGHQGIRRCDPELSTAVAAQLPVEACPDELENDDEADAE